MDRGVPFFSVIVPVYNSEQTLCRCIDSILSQSFVNFELILVDDGSTDRSLLIAERYVGQDIRVKVLNKENGGASSARNLGLGNAVGEWVTFCDSDDFVYADWLKSFADNCENVDLVAQGIRFDKTQISNIANNSDDVCFSFSGCVREYALLAFNNQIFGYTVNKCFKRNLIEQENLRFNESYVLREDEDFVLRYLKLCEYVVACEYVGYHYYMPNFQNKYISYVNDVNLCESLFKSSLRLYENDFNEHIREYLNLYTGVCIKNISLSNVKTLLKRYRVAVNRLIFETNLFIAFKYVIYYDFTHVLSGLVVYMYSQYIRRSQN